MASETTKLCLLLLISIINPVCIHGNYTVLVHSHSFSNPSNRCFQCQLGCCDQFTQTNCTGFVRCDTMFTYSLQPIGSNTTCTPQAVSETAFDDRPIDFTQETVLGLPNPLPLTGVSERWEGAVLYIAVIDDDSDTPINLPNDLIDDFMITIDSTLSVDEETEMALYWGRNNLTHIVLSFQVVCAPDFTGDRCETVIDNCIGPLSNCSGNGQCIDGIEMFTCDCWPGYTGEYCETDVDECLTMSGNCSNNGMCINGIDNFTCVCSAGYTGILCEEDINDCIDVECNGGTCQDKVDDFDCNCNPGFEGLLCEIDINECVIHNINCSGQGRCIDGANNYTCDCFSGYTGLECQTNIDDCVGVNCSGNRVCLDGINTYDCVCSAEYIGSDCTLHISQLKTITIAGPIGGFLFLFLILVCLIAVFSVIFRHFHQKRKRKEISLWLRQNSAQYEASAPFLRGDMEDRPQRRESNIYASITHHSKAAHRTAHPDDVEIHYWNEDSRFPPIQPSTESSSTSVLKPSSSDIEESMYLNPLYSGSEKESEST